MRVTALGSGDAFCSAGRGHTAWLVDDAQGTFAVDFGATALLALKRLGRDPSGIGAIHFTHLHGDHMHLPSLRREAIADELEPAGVSS